MSKKHNRVPGRRIKRVFELSGHNRSRSKGVTRYDDYEEGTVSGPPRLHHGTRIPYLWLPFLLLPLWFTSCVAKKALIQEQDRSQGYFAELNSCRESNDALDRIIREHENHILQLEYFRITNTNLLHRLADLSVVRKSGAESIRKSLEALDEQSKYIKDLNSSMRHRDSLNLALVMNLKRSLADVPDEDISIEVKKGVV